MPTVKVRLNCTMRRIPFAEGRAVAMRKPRVRARYHTIRKAASTVALSGLLLVGTVSVWSVGAIANTNSLQPDPLLGFTEQSQSLPQAVAEQVLQSVAHRLDLPQQALRIERFSRETWPDACLGIASPMEMCAAVVTEGWQVQIVPDSSDAESSPLNHTQSWFFRTNLTGSVVRLLNRSHPLPPSVSQRVVQAAATQLNLDRAELEVTDAIPQLWNSCLGLISPEALCNEIGILGWRVVVSAPTQSWIFHTNQTGSEIRLNEVASATSTRPTLMAYRSPVDLQDDITFQITLSGGFAGLTFQTSLLADGRVMQYGPNLDGTTSHRMLARLTPEQMQQFNTVLEQARLQDLNGISYSPPEGAADYLTVTLVSRAGVTRYSDIALEQLPSTLQQVIQAWQGLIDSQQT